MGEPEQMNTTDYLAGGNDFDPFVGRNLTPCVDGKAASLTFEEFVRVMRAGADLKDGQYDPLGTPLLQVRPWPSLAR